MARIPIFLTNGQPRTVDAISSVVIGRILGPRNPGVILGEGLIMVDIELDEPLEPGQTPHITACVKENQVAH